MPRFHVEKSVQIAAPIETVHGSLRDFRQWSEWSPWLIAEPECRVEYADDGKAYQWDGKIVGAGQLEVVGEKAGSIDYRLTFTRPWQSVNASAFRLRESGGRTSVTWKMEGTLPWYLFFMKGMMTTYVGMDYQRGLDMLKDKLERGSVPSKLSFPGPRPREGFSYVATRRTCPIPDLGPKMAEDLARVHAWFEENGTNAAGSPFSLYHKWDPGKQRVDYTTGIPVAEVPASLPDGLLGGEVPACTVYPVEHTGAYRHLGNAWSSGIMHGRAKVFQQSRKIVPFEVYENNPQEVAEEDLRTVVSFPLK